MTDTKNSDSEPETILDAVLFEEGEHSFRERNEPVTEQPYKTSSDTKGLMILMVVGGGMTMGILLLVLPDWAIPFLLGGFVGLFIAAKLALDVLQLLRRR